MNNLPDPFQSSLVGDDSFSRKRIILKNVLICKHWVNPHTPPKPEEIIKWMSKVPKKWTNVHVGVINYPEDYTGNCESNYIGLYGDRVETNAECKKRIAGIVSQWRRNYETFLRSLMFYKTGVGKAQIQEILKSKVKVWDGYPESTKEYKAMLKAERDSLERDSLEWETPLQGDALLDKWQGHYVPDKRKRCISRKNK